MDQPKLKLQEAPNLDFPTDTNRDYEERFYWVGKKRDFNNWIKSSTALCTQWGQISTKLQETTNSVETESFVLAGGVRYHGILTRKRLFQIYFTLSKRFEAVPNQIQKQKRWLNFLWAVAFDDLGGPQAFIEIKYKFQVNIFQKQVKRIGKRPQLYNRRITLEEMR